jgi:hypothetical protein
LNDFNIGAKACIFQNCQAVGKVNQSKQRNDEIIKISMYSYLVNLFLMAASRWSVGTSLLRKHSFFIVAVENARKKAGSGGRLRYQKVFYLFLMLLLSAGINAQISGFVFRDFNSNGVKDNTATFNETFLGGVTVKAYSAAGAEVGSTTTSATGAYSFTGLTLPLRIEFSGLTTEDYTGPAGVTNASSVQFYSAATSSANFGVNYPAHYCQAAPDYVVSRYKNVAVASSPSMIKVPYSASGTNNPAIETIMANKNQIGIVWGTAYNRTLSTIYAATFVKRHSGSTKDSDGDGKEDIGMIYSVPLTGSPAAWLNLTTLGVDVGLSSMPTIAQRGLNTTNVSDLSYDDQVFSQIGKIGLGDMDISDDDKYLYVVNLFDRKLYTIDIATKTLVGSGATIPSSCSGGVMRPFAVKYHRGKVYVGTVCDASVSQSRADLTATVYAFDGTTFSSVLSAPLNYAKGAAFINGPPGGPQYGTRWEPWTDDATLNTQFAFITSNGNRGIIYCQPMLADLEFDVNSDLILVFDDRLGHQSGTNNVGPDPTRTSLTLYTSVAGGDILRASFATGSYVLENNGTSGGVTTSGAGNNQGPGGGEFYTGDESLMYHQETVNGGAMLLAGYGEVAVTIVDPINFFAEGPRWMSNSTGLALRSYEVRPSTGFFNIEDGGKANGLGDLEVLCNSAPLEIGNRVWNDTNNDGIQDAGEAAIANVTLELFADFDNNGTPEGGVLGTVTTSPSGTWYFNATNVVDGDPSVAGNQAGPQPNKRYLIRVAGSDWTGGAGTGDLNGLSLTIANAGGAGQPDVRDNDASLSSSIPTISYLTGDAGENDHTLDMGFRAACALSNAGKTLETCNNNGTSSNGADDYITFSLNPTGSNLGATYSVTANNGGTVTLAGGGAATVVPYGSATAFRLQNGSANNTLYTITITDAGGAPCTVTTTVQQVSCSSSACTPPVLSVNNAAICAGESRDLAALVTGNTPAGTLSFHTTLADANAGVNPLTNAVVRPLSTTTYYIRSEITGACYSTASTQVTVSDPPVLAVVNTAICTGGSINLATLVTNNGGSTLSYFSSLENAQNNTNALASPVVTPASATNYFIRSTNAAGCYTIQNVVVSQIAANCGAIQITEPN